MTARHILAALAAAALAAPAAVATAQQRPAAQRDWTQVTAATPEGGFRMGNPDAPVKVVEYLSLTCPHCADFSRDGAPALIRNYVRSGRVSLEYRNYVLNGVDATASLLARCGGAASFFPMAERLFATQNQWTARISGIDQAGRSAIAALPPGQRLVRLAEIGGLTAVAAQHGVPLARGRACLADEAALRRLGEMNQAAAVLGIDGTPTFLINGTKVEAHDWTALEPLIRRAAGG